jgi:c-di-GMP-related signal transduction protein
LIFNIDVDDAIMSPIYTVENATISLAAENMSHFVVVNVASTVQNDEEKMCLLICAESTRICSELVCKKNYEPQILNGQFAARSSMI